MDILYRLGKEHNNVENAKLFFADILPNHRNNCFFDKKIWNIDAGEVFYFSINSYIISKGIFTGIIIDGDEDYPYGYELKDIVIIDSLNAVDNAIFKKNTSYVKSKEQSDELKRILSYTLIPEEVSENKNNLFEGSTRKITVNAYERNQEARQQCLIKYGYICKVCEFDFEKKYGTIGKSFIHVHHLKSLSEIKKEYKIDPIEDLRPVCPNCHAMIHKKNPAYIINELKNMIEANDL